MKGQGMEGMDIEVWMNHRGEISHEKNHEGLPIIPPLRPEPSRPADGAVAICGECGRRILAVECYSCPNDRCPVQPKATCATTGVWI